MASGPISSGGIPTLPATAAADMKEEAASGPEPLFDILDLTTRADPDALMVKVGVHGSVRLQDCMPRLVHEGTIGMEAAIVRAARVSYGHGTKTISTDLGLLRYLMRNEHMTPFEMLEFVFMVDCELFTARQWMRHRMASYNEYSLRYSITEDDRYYLPAPDDVRPQSTTNKQGSGAPASLTADAKLRFSEGAARVVAVATEVYQQAILDGVAREQARAVLPVGGYTKFYYKTNARSLFNFLSLRMDSHAQAEIRGYANAIYTIVKKVAPHLMSIFDTYVQGSVRLSALEVRALRTGVAPDEMSEPEKREWAAKRAALQPTP